MHATHKYNTQSAQDSRRAVLELVQWLGFKRSLLILRWLHQWRFYRGWTTPAAVRFTLSMGGVEGFPVTAAWRRWAMKVK